MSYNFIFKENLLVWTVSLTKEQTEITGSKHQMIIFDDNGKSMKNFSWVSLCPQIIGFKLDILYQTVFNKETIQIELTLLKQFTL
jgi:hypothetical protein